MQAVCEAGDAGGVRTVVEVPHPEAVIELGGHIELGRTDLVAGLAQDLLQHGVARGQLVRVRRQVGAHEAQ